MNLAQLLGEQQLRIEQLQDLALGRGVDPSAGVDVQELRARLRAAIEARESEADAHRQEKARLQQIADGLRRQLQGHPLQLRLDAEVKARAAEAMALRKRILELEWQVKHGVSVPRSVPAPQSIAATPPAQPPDPAPPLVRAPRVSRGPLPGTCAAAIEALLEKMTVPIGIKVFKERLPQFTESNISVMLLYLHKGKRITRTGRPYHFLYQKKQQGPNNA